MLDLAISLNDLELEFDEQFNYMASYVVYEDEMTAVLKEPEKAAHRVAYRVYRDVARFKDRTRFAMKKMHLDITVIASGMIGDEYMKGTGHYHPAILGSVPAAEIYQVMQGEILFILQKTSDMTHFQVEDLEVVHMRAGETIIVPPYYGHGFVNISEKPSVLANLTLNSVVVNYEQIRAHHGLAVYVTQKDGVIVVEKNPHYGDVPEIKRTVPVETRDLGIDFQKSIYTIAIENLYNFSFMGNIKRVKDVKLLSTREELSA